jgi:hypothetical protein
LIFGFYLEQYLVNGSLKVVSGEKKGGSKVYSIDGYYCGTVALGIFFHCVVNEFPPFTVTPAQPVGTVGENRHGGQNCYEGRHLLLLAPVEVALETFDHCQGWRSKITTIFTCFDRRFYRRS